MEKPTRSPNKPELSASLASLIALAITGGIIFVFGEVISLVVNAL